MQSLILKNIVEDSSSNLSGALLFGALKEAWSKKERVLLHVDSDMTLSSSFLNSSIGQFLDQYGLDTFKEVVQFKGSKNQFQRIASYISSYSKVYSV